MIAARCDKKKAELNNKKGELDDIRNEKATRKQDIISKEAEITKIQHSVFDKNNEIDLEKERSESVEKKSNDSTKKFNKTQDYIKAHQQAMQQKKNQNQEQLLSFFSIQNIINFVT